MKIKKLDIYMLKSYIPLLAGAFVVALFVFIMQFLWRYVDDLIGKGLSLQVLGKFFWYATLTLVSNSLPLAVLLSSLILFGNMGEQLELTALKTAGIPLKRISTPVGVLVVVLAGVSFVFQNNVSPRAQKQLIRFIASLKQTNPVLEIPEGVFYSGIPNINLFVQHKNADTGMLYGVMIYKLDRGWDNQQIMVADSARLQATADKHFLQLVAYSGEQFENLQDAGSRMMESTQVPYDRESFGQKTLLIAFDTGFDLMDDNMFGEQSKVKNLRELRVGYDSLMGVYDSIGKGFAENLQTRFLSDEVARPRRGRGVAGAKPAEGTEKKKDAEEKKGETEYKVESIDSVTGKLSEQKRLAALRSAATAASAVLGDLEWEKNITHDGYKNARKHMIQWHKKFALSLACVIFFLIGSSLGAIIRKGGLGVPTVISVVIFIIYYIIDTGSMKTAREGDIPIWLGMWTSTFCLAPLALWLSRTANNDSMLLNPAAIPIRLRALLGVPEKRTVAMKEVIIDNPDYGKEVECCRQLQVELEALQGARKLEDVGGFAGRIEDFAERLGNSRDARLLHLLEGLPILSTRAVGRLRLKKDLAKAGKVLKKIEERLNKLTNNNE